MQQQLICHVTSVHKRDDIRIFVKECSSLAQNTSYQVVLLVADSLGDDTTNAVTILDVGKATTRFKRMLDTPQALYKKIIELKPQLVHFHDPELMLIGKKLAKSGVKVIYDVHEDLPKQILAKPWIAKILRKPLAYLVEKIENHCVSKYSGIIAATETIAKRLTKHNSQVAVVHNYPILSELATISTPWHSRDNSLGYIGSISLSRGIMPLIESLAHSKLKLELAGILSDDVSLANLSSLPSYQYVNYHGVLNRQQITELLSKIKIGVVTLLPTPSYVESLPIKLFEYMLAGIPVIASNFELWRDIVEKFNCGLMVDPTLPQDIAKACQWLLANPELASQMGQNGRLAVIQKFNWEIEVTQLVTFYAQVLAR